MPPGPGEVLTRVFPGDSEMARRMRRTDWEATPLGPPAGWPTGLTAPLGMMLTSRFEMWLGWGDELTFFYNDAYIPTLGVKHPGALGRPFREVWGEVYADVEPQVVSVMRRGEATWNKARLLLLERNGYPEETYHTFSYSPLRDGDAVRGMLCIVTEETERVISERRLETMRRLSECLIGAMSQEAVLQALCEALASNTKDFPFALAFVHDPDRGLVGRAATPEARPLLQRPWPLDEAAGAQDLRLDPGEALPSGPWSVPPERALVLPVPGPRDTCAAMLVLGLNPHRRADHGLFDLARLLVGRAAGAFAQARAVEAERRRFDRIWTHARDLMVVVDSNGVFRSVSPAWTRILGHPVEEVVGRNIKAFVAPEDLAMTKAEHARLVTGEQVTGFENRYRTADGAWRWISWNTASEEGVIYGYGRDVTDEKLQSHQLREAEDALRQAQKMEAIGQLTGGVAHDFNNLLTVIRSSADLLRREGVSEARRRRYVDAISDTADRAARLTSQLLAFSRRQALKPERFDLATRVETMAVMLRPVLGARIRLQILVECDRCVVEADVGQFETALINLAVNGRDAMDGEGDLIIRVGMADRIGALRGHAAIQGDFVSIAVEDHGSGIPAKDMAKIFDPFFTTKEVGRGTGLGLSQVYGFAKQSGGDLDVESVEGRGSTFTLYLPRSSELPLEAPALQEPQALSHQGRVLVVEDNPKIGEFATQLLGDLGYDTTWVASGDAALAALEQDACPDLVFTDVVMPGIDGVELARTIQRRWPQIRVVLTTGYSDALAGDARHGLPLLQKPYSVEELSRILHEVAARPPAHNSPDLAQGISIEPTTLAP